MAQYVEVNGQTIEFPDGMAAKDMEAAIKANFLSIKPAEPASVSAGKVINDIPRQIGLTARYAIEGPAQALQVFTEPLREIVTDPLLRAVGALPSGEKGQSKTLGQSASALADWMGLPSPQGANERVIADAARMVAGAGGFAGAANAASKASQGVTQSVLQGLAANPAQQLSSAAGAGLAGGASREAGGGVGAQTVASVLGGVAAGLAPGAVQSLYSGLKGKFTPSMSPQDLDVKISGILNQQGVDYAKIPEQARAALRNELRSALSAGKELDPAAVARLADFRALGVTPTRGTVTLDPVQITREKNLSKLAANTSEGELTGLPRIENNNNARLISVLNDVGAASYTDPIVAGRYLNESVLGTQARLRQAEQAAWEAAKSSPAYTQPIHMNGLNAMNRALGDEGLMPFMNPTISRYIEAFQNGQAPFTPQAYKNLQSMLSAEMSKGGNEARAAGIARRALESAEIIPVTNPRGIDFGNAVVTPGVASAMRSADQQAGNTIDAINRARAATRQAYAYEDSSPMVRSILSDSGASDPSRIAKRFVIGSTPDEAALVAQQVGPSGREVIKSALASYIKKEALSGASDEVGKISQSKLNGVLNTIGAEKLRLFFSPEEIAQLQRAGRVASYVQVQPIGSAVNNSNSGALLLGRGMDMLNGVASKIPMGKAAIVDPAEGITLSIGTRNAQSVLPGLLVDQPRPPFKSGLVLPGFAAAGGLLSP